MIAYRGSPTPAATPARRPVPSRSRTAKLQSPVTFAGPRSPCPTVALAIASIASRLFLACSRNYSSISIRGLRSRSATYSFSIVLSAMYGQMLQLQFPSAPGAPMKVLPGKAFSIW